LINLIGNSLKFTFQGSITISAKIIEYGGYYLEMMVCDTGMGINPEDRGKVFQMFGKLEATSKMNTSGVGLGLSICKQIVEELQGEIELTTCC
jgi:signal transduction histidine kinase